MKNTTQKLQNVVQSYTIRLSVLLCVMGFQAHATTLSANSKAKFTVQTNRVWINATGANGAFSQTLMGYRAGATDGFDHGLDGAYMNDGPIALTSLIGNVRYTIQFKGVPSVATDAVPLSFSANSYGTYTFAIDHMDGFFTNNSSAVIIYDMVTNTYNNLKTSNYTFTTNAGMYNNRFQLLYSTTSTALGTNQNTFTSENLAVWKNNTDIIINSGTTVLKEITLYSINGQLLYQNQNNNSNQIVISPLTLSKQPIIIRATTLDGLTVFKKWLYL